MTAVFNPLCVLAANINRLDRPPPIHNRIGPAIAAVSINPQDIRTQIGKQHRAMRPWANTGEFHHTQSG
jgi:hypothetical protein